MDHRMSDVYYRFEDELVGTGGFSMDGDYEPGPAYLRVKIVTFPVEKRTPKGAWVKLYDGTRFIADRWFCKFANPTVEGARADFIARKRRLIAIQTRRIRDAEEAIELAKADKERSFYGRSIQVPA